MNVLRMLNYMLFNLFVAVLVLETPTGSSGNLQLTAVPSSVVKAGQKLALHCSFTNSSEWETAETASCSFLWSHSPPFGDRVQKIFMSRTPGITISTSQGVFSNLTVHSVGESNAGLYRCHIVCGQHHSDSGIRIQLKADNSDDVTSSTTPLSKRKTKGWIGHGGVIAFAGLTGLMLITGMCAITISRKRVYCCACISESHEDSENNNISTTTMRSRTFSDDPPAYETVIKQPVSNISGRLCGFLGLNSGSTSNDHTCPRCASRASTTLSQNQSPDSRPTCTQDAVADSQNGPSYIHVSCGIVPSPVEKPPDYWTWMKEHKIKDVLNFGGIPPPLYDCVLNLPARTLSSSATGAASDDSVEVISSSTRISQMDRETNAPSLGGPSSGHNGTNL